MNINAIRKKIEERASTIKEINGVPTKELDDLIYNTNYKNRKAKRILEIFEY